MGRRSVNSQISNQRGQFVIEAVLLMIVAMTMITLLTRGLKNMDFVQSLTSGPWVKLSGMVENGVWETPEQSRAKHPNHSNRKLTSDPRRM